MNQTNHEKKTAAIKVAGGVVGVILAYAAAYVAGTVVGNGIAAYLNARKLEDEVNEEMSHYE